MMLDDADDTGSAFCAAVLARLERSLWRAGPRPRVVFDIDNTLVDTRPRTLLAARTFVADGLDEAHRLRRLGLAEVAWDGRLTALAVGLPAALVEAFHAHWDAVFWDAAHFALDAPIANVCDWVHAAVELGAEPFYLTGRITALAPATLEQLERMGLPQVDPEHVLCKPSMAERTSDFKHRMLTSLAGQGDVAWSMSDTGADALTALALQLPAVHVDFPVRAGHDPVPDVAVPRLVARVPR